MNRVERLERDNQIVDAWKRGMSKKQIAKQLGIAVRTVDRAIEKFLKGQLPGSSAGSWSAIEMLIEAHEQAELQAAAIAEQSPNPRTTISAIRLQTQVASKRAEMMFRAGLLPSVRQGVLSRVNAEQIQLELGRMLRLSGVDPDTTQAALAVIAEFSEIPDDDVEKSALKAMEKVICETPEGAMRFAALPDKNPRESVAE